MLTMKQLNTKIRSIAKRNAKLRDDIQEILVNIAGHAYEHGDTTICVNLLNSVRGQDKVAIVKWLRDFAFTIVKTDGSVALNKSARNKADFVDGAAVVESLADAPKWYDDAVTDSQAAKVLDPVARVKALIKSVEKADDVKVELDALIEACAELQFAVESKNLREAA